MSISSKVGLFRLVLRAILFCVVSSWTVALAQEAGSAMPAWFARPAESDRSADTALAVSASLPQIDGQPDLELMMQRQADLLEALPAEVWEVDALAESLGSDPATAYQFVRDHIAFDPYAGVLRGADGALAARAANSWDRALLLRALLEHHGHVTRLAFGELDDDTIDGLLAVATQDAVSALDSPDVITRASTFDLQLLADRAKRDYALLMDALSAAGELDALGRGDDPGSSRADAVVPDLRAAIRSHAWVQLGQADGTWLDLDASLPDAGWGVTLAQAATTSTDVPGEMRHAVVVRVLVETLDAGDLEEAVYLEVPLTSVEAAGTEMWLLFQPEQSSGDVGLLGSVGGKGWQPILLVNEEALGGLAFPLRSSGGGGFGGMFGGGGGPQVTRVTLELLAK